jgi:hypothetical protein
MGTPITYSKQAKRTYSGLAPALYDKIEVAYPDTVTEIYTYSMFNEDTGNQQVTAMITVVYTDATKDFISSVTKTYNAPDL